VPLPPADLILEMSCTQKTIDKVDLVSRQAAIEMKT